MRYWDADKFDQILTLRAHHAEVWAVAPSRSGALVASVSRDRSLRLWRRSDEQVFIEEERENELEQIFEAGLEKKQDAAEAEEEEAAALGLEGGVSEAAAAGRRTIESVKGAERVLEALKTLAEEVERKEEFTKALETWTAKHQRLERTAAEASGMGGAVAAAANAALAAHSKPPALVPNMLLLGLDEGGYLLKALGSVRATELEQALLLVPFDAARSLLTRLLPLLPTAPPAELMARCTLFLLKVHHKQIVANHSMRTLLHELDSALRTRLTAEQSVLGYNLAAMRFVKNSMEASDSGKFFEAALEERAKERTSAVAAGAVGELRRKTAARVKKGSKRAKNA